MLNLIIELLYRRKWTEKNFNLCLNIFFVLERLFSSRLDHLDHSIHQNKTQSYSVHLQVSDKVGRQALLSALTFLCYICVSEAGMAPC